MKVSHIFTLVTLTLACFGATGHSAVIAGWDDWGGYSAIGTAYTPDQQIAGLAATLSVGSNQANALWNSTDGTFGSTAGASTTGNALILSQSNSALVATLTLTNNSGFAYNLEAIRFDFAPRTNAASAAGPNAFSLVYTSGDLGAGGVNIGSQSGLAIVVTNSTDNALSDYPDYDLNLSPALSDTVLGIGEQAVFTLTLSGQGNPNVGSLLDNVAFTGTVIPEPVSDMLLGLGGLLLLAGRRRRGQG